MEPLIIECALNEQASREQNPAVPIAPDEIVRDALEAARAGAAIVHLHARDPHTGAMLHPGTEVYREIFRRIREREPELLLYPTYGSSPTPEQRFSHLVALAADPEVRLDFATIDPGAVNYADLASVVRAGEPRAPRTGEGGELVLSVSHAECRYFFETANRLGFLYSETVRELGHVRHLASYWRAGWIRWPLLLKLVLSENHAWGLPPRAESFAWFTGVLPPGIPHRWMAYVEGEAHTELCRYAVEHGGHVRTGLGDNPVLDGKRLTNAEQVECVVALARLAGRSVATPAEARRLLRSPPG
jgi:uncharacterized protein (DUF849 family)